MTRTGKLKRLVACMTAVITVLTLAAASNEPLINSEVVSAESSEKLRSLNEEAQKKAEEIQQTKEQLEELAKKQAELDEKINKTQGDIDAEEETQAAIEEQIRTVEETIFALQDSIDKLTSKIEVLTDSIAQKEVEIAEKRVEIEQGVIDFKKRIRIMYVAGSESYTDILVGATDFYDMLMKLELVKRVADHDSGQIDHLIELKDQYESDLVALENEKEILDADKADLEEQSAKQSEQKGKLEELFLKSRAVKEQLENDKAAFQATQDVTKQEQDAFEAEMQKLYEEQEAIKQATADEKERLRKEEEERKRKEEEERKRREEEERKRKEEEERQRQALLQKQQQQQQTTTAPTSPTLPSPSTVSNGNVSNAGYGYVDKSMFTWPVPGFYYISYGVGWRWGSYHKGIDIYSPGIRGAKICAAADGKVIRVENNCPHDFGKNYSCGCGGGYGNYCIIDHGNGYWTLYGHSERITVTVGQTVKQGDVLGTVGSTGHSTGPHLHFEVRLNGVAQNPQLYV
ncbi:MAG: peptidoglycan DD-metalloendopeptidase family protein [Ruminococcus sp.]|nr:peptidoglycan DD-metalloendopeptidase family protein [Ruminococcus sp.]